MILKHPFQIAPNLEPGVYIGEKWITISYSPLTHDGGRTRYRWCIFNPNNFSVSGDDLRSGVGKHGLKEGMMSLLAFLSAFGEPGSENQHLFTHELLPWVIQYRDEISLTAIEVEETPDCLVE